MRRGNLEIDNRQYYDVVYILRGVGSQKRLLESRKSMFVLDVNLLGLVDVEILTRHDRSPPLKPCISNKKLEKSHFINKQYYHRR